MCESLKIIWIGQSAAKLLNEYANSYGEGSTTIPEGSRNQAIPKCGASY